MPVGTSSVWPGASVIGLSMQARRSRPGGAGGGVMRQLIAHARIEDFNVEFFHETLELTAKIRFKPHKVREGRQGKTESIKVRKLLEHQAANEFRALFLSVWLSILCGLGVLGGSAFFDFRDLIKLGDVGDELAREFGLGCARQRVRAFVVEQRDFVIVRADRVLREIGDHQRHFLFAPFGVRELVQLLALGGETDAEWRLRQRRDPRENVRVGHQFQS